jgi:hypothetical protein
MAMTNSLARGVVIMNRVKRAAVIVNRVKRAVVMVNRVKQAVKRVVKGVTYNRTQKHPESDRSIVRCKIC